MRHAASFAAVSLAFLASGTAHAQSAPDLADLVGARAAGAETQMEARGYTATGGNTVRDTKFTFWWNQRRGTCVSVSTNDGRYAAIQAVPPGNCNQDGPSPDPRPTPGYQDQSSLVLVCYGAGTKPTVTSNPEYQWNHDKHRWEWTSRLGNTAKGFNSDVQIELYGDHGRIHLGPSLVPPIHSGGDNGWWDLSDLVITRDRITAGYRLNGMNKPRLTVDRRSGRIAIQAMTNFSGQCDIGNWGAGQRRF